MLCKGSFSLVGGGKLPRDNHIQVYDERGGFPCQKFTVDVPLMLTGIIFSLINTFRVHSWREAPDNHEGSSSTPRVAHRSDEAIQTEICATSKGVVDGVREGLEAHL